MKLRILRLVATLAASGLAALVRLWSRTWRLEIRGADRLVAARRDGGGARLYRAIELDLAGRPAAGPRRTMRRAAGRV